MPRILSPLMFLVCLAIVSGCGGDSDPSEDSAAEQPTPVYETPAPIGGPVPDFTLDDQTGRAFQLTALDATRADIERTLRTVGAEYGLAADAPLDTQIETLSGLLDDDELDTYMKWELLANVGGPYGRAASEESIESILTLKDVIDWIERVNGSPTVFVIWSPRCKTCPKINDRIQETLASIDARLVAVAGSYGDRPEHFEKVLSLIDFPFRILPDGSQEITKRLGAKTTPTFVVVDKDLNVRYRGALDDDPSGVEDLADRAGYVVDAVAAARSGGELEITETDAPG